MRIIHLAFPQYSFVFERYNIHTFFVHMQYTELTAISLRFELRFKVDSFGKGGNVLTFMCAY